MIHVIRSGLLLLCLSAGVANAQLVITEPSGNDDEVAAGHDFATQELVNAWSMDDRADVTLADSTGMASQDIAEDLYTAVGSSSNDPAIYLLSHGFPGTVPFNNGALHPIDTTRYRYATVKMRVTDAGGAPLSVQDRQLQFIWLRDSSSFVTLTFGYSQFIEYAADPWVIVTVDLLFFSWPDPSVPKWDTYAKIEGFRFDPTPAPNARIDIDWVRLTGDGVTTAQRFRVTWNDSGNSTYTVWAVDADGVVFTLGTNVAGREYLADLSRLEPGNYTIRVARAGATVNSPGVVRINRPPQPKVLSPNARGDQTRNYALVEQGQQWGPIETGDIRLTENLANVRYDSPTGSFTGRPTSNDPTIHFNTTGRAIDTAVYRALCYTMQVHGPRDLAIGSVARVYFGNLESVLSASEDIVVEEGLNEYCIEDLDKMPLETTTGGTWTGSRAYIRLDSHEFPVSDACSSNATPANCRDVRLDSFVLSPFHRANPTFDVQWNTADPDDTTIAYGISLDPDRIVENGNEIAFPVQSGGVGNGSYLMTAALGVVPAGTYYVTLTADDGLNPVTTHAGGPLVVVPDADPAALIFRNGFE